MTAGAIEKNEALKLVKQLSCDIGVQEQVKELALQVSINFIQVDCVKFMAFYKFSGSKEVDVTYKSA